MTEKQALLCAINTISDVIEQCIITYGWDDDDPYLVEIREAQKKLKEMYQAR